MLTREIALDVQAARIETFQVGNAERTRFGELTFRGGVALSSREPAFGGLSGIAMQGDGQGFLALSDRGAWFRAKLLYDKEHRPVGLTDCIMAPMIAADGRLLQRSRSFDTESLAVAADGSAYVGIERSNEILHFDLSRAGFAARGKAIPTPPGFKKLPHNKGPEALGIAPPSSPLAGSLVVIAERARPEPNAPTVGFVLTGPMRGQFDLARSKDFDITDLTFLPNGDMLVLERFYTPVRGVFMRMRRIAGRSIRPGALLDGEVLIEADMGSQIDNMEALGIHRDPAGGFVLTLLSDDNFSMIQRNLLLQFHYAG